MANYASCPNGRGLENDDTVQLRLTKCYTIQPIESKIILDDTLHPPSRFNSTSSEDELNFFRTRNVNPKPNKWLKLFNIRLNAILILTVFLGLSTVNSVNAAEHLPIDVLAPEIAIPIPGKDIKKVKKVANSSFNFTPKSHPICKNANRSFKEVLPISIYQLELMNTSNTQNFDIEKTIEIEREAPVKLLPQTNNSISIEESPNVEIVDNQSNSNITEGYESVSTEALSELREQAKQENKMYFLKFGAKWCHPCKIMDKGTFKNPKVAKYINDNYLQLNVDVDEIEGMSLKYKYGVKLLPTIIIFNSEGHEVARFEETLSSQKMLAQLIEYNQAKYNEAAVARKTSIKKQNLQHVLEDFAQQYVVVQK